jgi:FKBP-type peptidyl-prolyl cis-trans isomerase
MAADPKNTPKPGEPSRQQMMRVLIPAGAIAIIVILVAVLVASFDGNKPADEKGKGGSATDVTAGTGKPMPYDKSNGGTDDPELKDIGGGLRIRDLKVGSGDPCPRGATVTIHYTGWNVRGDEFDSSKKTGGPVTFELGGLIKGWQEGIPGMKPGGVRKLVVPAALAYGSSRRGEHIPPGATLIFEVELVKAN